MSWIRRNRWGLIFVIPAMLLAIIGNSDRVAIFWLPSGNKIPQTFNAGQTLNYRGTTQDFNGTWQVAFSVKVVSAEPVDTPLNNDGEPADVKTPAGARWYAVKVHVEADPHTAVHCTLSLVDAQGREAVLGATDIGRYEVGDNGCTPDNTPGPLGGDPAHPAKIAPQDMRPAAYDLNRYVLTATGFTPTRVRLKMIGSKYYYDFTVAGAK